MQIKIKVKKGYEPEDVLVKALKTIRAEREQGKLDDPYLRYLQEYSLNLYDTVMAQMEKEIVAVLTNQPLKKSIGTVRLKVPYDKLNQELLRKSTKGKVLTAVTVNAKTGQYQSHRWKNPNQAFDIALSDIKKQAGNIEDIKFIDKKTNKESSEEEILNNYAKQDSKVTLQNFIKEKYLIDNKTKKETPKAIVKNDEIKYNKAKHESFYNEPIDLNKYRERIVKPDEVIKHLQGSKDIYEREVDNNSIKDITFDFIKALGIEKPVIEVGPLNAHGACEVNPFAEVVEIGDMLFNSTDSRDKEYRLKTVFHESAHKLSHGAKVSDNEEHRLLKPKYTKADESLTECIALYLAKQVYPNMDYALSYGQYLFDVLQFIKDIEGFQDCTTISDVGKVAFEKRLSGEIVDIDKFYKARAKHMRTRKKGFTNEFYKKHSSYIKENAKEISKLVAKGLNAEEHALSMELDIYKAVTRDITKLEGNQKLVMEMALTISMERNGIGFDKKPEEPKAPEEPKEIKIDKEELEKVEELLKPLKYGSGMNVKGKKKAAENLLIDTSQRVNTALQNKGVDNDAEISMEMNALLAALNSGSITISQAMNDPRFASAAYLFIKAILEDDDELDQAIMDVLGGL